MSDNDQWLKQFRTDIVDHMEKHTSKCVETLQQLEPGSEEACEVAADLAKTEQSLETIKRRLSEER